MTQFLSEYTQYPASAYPGMPVDSVQLNDWISLTNSGLAARQTVAGMTVGGTIGTETFTVTVNGTDPVSGLAWTAIATSVGSGALNTAALIAADLTSKLNANLSYRNYATASVVGAVISQTAKQPNVNPISSVAGTASGSATLTASPVVTSFILASTIPYGYGIGQAATDNSDECRLWAGSGTLRGLCVLGQMRFEQNHVPFPRFNSPISATFPSDGVPMNRIAAVARSGRWYTSVGDAVARNALVYVNNTTGRIQGSSSGATALGSSTFLSSTSAAGMSSVQLNGL
jgi:hypothetical protein